MSLSLSGLNAKALGGDFLISVDPADPLLKLANLINWESLYGLVLADLKNTAAGRFGVGRKLHLRPHLGAYILQAMHNSTDRETEERTHFDARWGAFAGRAELKNWKAPDHTAIEKFRNRLSPATHHLLGVEIMRFAKLAGFAKPDWMDVDSTVQEANISYPSDATLMAKIGQKAHIVAEAMASIGKNICVNLKAIKGTLKEYLFLAKNKTVEIKREVFSKLHNTVVSEVVPVVEAALQLTDEQLLGFGHKSLAAMDILFNKAVGLLEDIRIFIKTQKMVPTKILSLHASLVACISKGKLGKPHEFGRVFQLGRVEGNFLLIGKSKTIRESDKSAIGPMIYQHSLVFGPKTLSSIGGDKGYASKKNIRSAKAAGIKEVAIQQPHSTKNGRLEHSPERKVEVENRRAGIEPLIGHCKQKGLLRSRMKSDSTTESSAYRSVMGFNLRQIRNHFQAANG
jgi:transposase, IS5 family